MKALTLTILAAILLPACGHKDDGPVGLEDPLTTPEGLCDAWAEAACTEEVTDRCAARSRADCRDAQADFCRDQVGDGPFERDEAELCVEDVRLAYADAVIDYAEWQNVVAGVFGNCADLNPRGADPNGDEGRPLVGGADCDPETDVCMSSHFCDLDRRYCRPRAEVGQPCCENDPMLIEPVCTPFPCVEEAYCSGPSGEQTCVGRGGESDDCETDRECAAGLLCVEGGGGRICTDKVYLGTGSALCDELA
ncbi:MAG: hypothetical protein JW751_15680 [Polyangiaceae bacterium]|nr:hypothetical protein [Polyangiaceae bacterium]